MDLKYKNIKTEFNTYANRCTWRLFIIYLTPGEESG